MSQFSLQHSGCPFSVFHFNQQARTIALGLLLLLSSGLLLTAYGEASGVPLEEIALETDTSDGLDLSRPTAAPTDDQTQVATTSGDVLPPPWSPPPPPP